MKLCTLRPAATRRILPPLALLAALALAAGCGLGQSTATSLGDYWYRQDSGLNKRVVLVPLGSGLPNLRPRAAGLSRALKESLGALSGVKMVPPGELLAEMKRLPASYANLEDRLVEAARKLGINIVVSGAISDLSVSRRKTGIYLFRSNTPFLGIEAHLRVVDVATGAVLGAKAFRRDREIDEELADNMAKGKQPPDKMVRDLAAKLSGPTSRWLQSLIARHPWSGFILGQEKGRLKVTVSRDTGLSKGDVLSVAGRGERLRAGSGRTYYLPAPPVGQIRLVEVGRTTSWAVPVGKTPLAAFKPGLLLRTR